MSKKDKSTFGHFFKEDDKAVQEIFNGQVDQEPAIQVSAIKKEVFPTIPPAEQAPEDDFNAYWLRLRSFFRAANNTVGLTEGLFPVVMAPLYTQATVGSDFPVWVAGTQETETQEFCLSLNAMLSRAFYTSAPGENDAIILKRSQERILHIANDQFTDKKPRHFLPIITQVLDILASELDVKGDEGEAFKADIENLKKALPANGYLIPYSANTSFQLLEAASDTAASLNRNQLAAEIEDIKSKLQDLLTIEESKNPDKASKEGKSVTVDFMDSIVNFNEISTMAPASGTISFGEGRLNRIKGVVNDLQEAEATLKHHCFLFVDEDLQAHNAIDWANLFENSTIQTYQTGAGIDAIRASFQKHITDWTRIFKAKRIGEFELKSNYLPEIHNDYFTHFDWENFSTEELRSCPHFILIADENALFESELSQLNSVLGENLPIKIVSVKSDQSIDSKPSSSGASLHASSGMGALMLSHKNIYVAQSTTITPEYLFNTFIEGLRAFAPAFFSVLNVEDKFHSNPYLWTSAAVESRDFPGFTFKGLLGTPWGSRFEVQNNPQPHIQWPLHKKTIINAEGEKVEMTFPFTYAHQAALSASYHQYFTLVDPSYWDDNLIPLIEYNTNTVEENIGKIPFIWLLNVENVLCKIAVSWPVVLATQERLDFWRFLQENSGINNYHVNQAVENAKSEMLELHTLEIEKLQTEHAAEVERIREEEAGNVMENLTSVLLNLDTSHIPTSSTKGTFPSGTPEAASKTGSEAGSASEAESSASEAVAEDEESVLSNDPYIDTALCTSCNECTDLNGIMFKYNTDKMAFIADPKAGTFLELVKAAELCPVGIIHPGSPLNPAEADIDSLILRAEKFN